MIKSFVIAIIIMLLGMPAQAETTAEMVPVYKLKPTWTSKRMDATIWGFARADLNGDGIKENVVLEKNALWIGTIEGNKLTKGVAYTFDPYTQGLRIFTMNLDDKPGDEVVISAVSYQQPASLILSFDGSSFTTLASKIRWHLRVLEQSGKRMLIGQRSIPDQFFTGKIYELAFDNGKLKRKDKLDLPRNTRIFEFAIGSNPDDEDILIQLKGYDKMMALEQRGTKKWKRFWKSGARFGGTLRYVDLKDRPPLQDLPRYEVPIFKSPVTLNEYGANLLIGAKQDLPLRDIIMKKPLIEGGTLVEFTYDDGLGYRERIETERLPGFIADYVIDRDGTTGAAQLYVAIQTDPHFFQPGTQSALVIFTLPQP